MGMRSPGAGGLSVGMRMGWRNARGCPGQHPCAVHRGPQGAGGPWELRGPKSLSTHGSRAFVHDPTVQITADHDRTAEDESESDQA